MRRPASDGRAGEDSGMHRAQIRYAGAPPAKNARVWNKLYGRLIGKQGCVVQYLDVRFVAFLCPIVDYGAARKPGVQLVGKVVEMFFM